MPRSLRPKRTLFLAALLLVGLLAVAGTRGAHRASAALANSSINLTISPNPSAVGTSTTVTAAVSPNTCTGTVNFYSNGFFFTAATLSSGTATFTFSPGTAGTYQFTAAYPGDGTNCTGSTTSSPTTLTVLASAATTTTSLNVSPNPANLNQNVTLQATVTASGTCVLTASDTVTFNLVSGPAGNNFPTPPANTVTTTTPGTATLTFAPNKAGTYKFTATYNGNSNCPSNTSSQQTLTVGAASSTTTLTISPNPSVVGTSTTVTATVSPNTCTGTVNFYSNGFFFTAATISSTTHTATFTFSPGTAGTYQFTAAYPGDGTNCTGSTSSPTTLTVLASAATTSVLLSFNPATGTVGTQETLTATVTPTSPCVLSNQDQVLFHLVSGPNGSNGWSGDQTASVNSGNGQASVNFTPSQKGTYIFTATYQPAASNTTCGSSTSSQQTLTVVAVSTTTTLSAGSYSGSGPLPLTATVSAGAGCTLTNTDTVTFTLVSGPTGNNFPTPPANTVTTTTPGTATLTFTPGAVGTYTFAAAYNGNGTCATSVGSSGNVSVTAVAPTLSVHGAHVSTSLTPSLTFYQVNVTITGGNGCTLSSLDTISVTSTSLGGSFVTTSYNALSTIGTPSGNSVTITVLANKQGGSGLSDITVTYTPDSSNTTCAPVTLNNQTA